MPACLSAIRTALAGLLPRARAEPDEPVWPAPPPVRVAVPAEPAYLELQRQIVDLLDEREKLLDRRPEVLFAALAVLGLLAGAGVWAHQWH